MNIANSKRLVQLAALLYIAATGIVLAAPSFPAADYDAGGVTLSFGSGGKFRVLQGTAAMVEGTYTTDGDKVVLTDVSGPYACTADKKTGTYAWHIDGNTLTLTKVDDACDDRASDVTGHPWQKK